MEHFKNLFIPVTLSTVLVAWTGARADMGSVWVEAVTSDSITINWSDPQGIHFLAGGNHHYRVSWQLVNTYQGRDDFPNPSSLRVELFSEQDKPFTIAGLESGDAWNGEGGHYRIKVETYAGKLNPYGGQVPATFRLTGVVRQKTLWAMADPKAPAHHNLRLAAATPDSIGVVLSNVPAGFDKIRFAYKGKWQAKEAVDLTSVAGEALGPAGTWFESNGQRGWEDRFPADVISVTFPGLDPARSYEVVVYGFQIGISQGTYLGRVSGRTAGFKPLTSWEAVVATNHQDVLYDYAQWCKDVHGGARFLDVVAEHIPSLTGLPSPCPEPPARCESDRDFVLRDDGDDLAGDLMLLLYLVEAQPDQFAEWQAAEAESGPGATIETFLYKYRAWLIPAIDGDVDPWPTLFLRGDVDPNGRLDLSDAIAILSFLFTGGMNVSCMDAADVGDDGLVDISDPIQLLAALYRGGSTIAQPIGSCGIDPTPEDRLDCKEYSSCPY